MNRVFKTLFVLLLVKPIILVVLGLNVRHRQTVVIHGLGKALPKGDAVFVPFNCDVVIGDAINIGNDSKQFVEHLANDFDELPGECITRHKPV